MTKKRAWIIGVVAAVAVVIGGSYTARGLHYQHRFLPHTQLLGVNIGGKTVAAAEQAVTRGVQQERFAFKENGATKLTATGAKLGLTVKYTTQLQKLMKAQNPWGFSAATVVAGTKDTDIKALTTGATFTAFMQETAKQLNTNRRAPQNAKVVASGDKFVVQKEKAGNTIDPQLLGAAVAKSVLAGKHTVALASAYAQPRVRATSKKLIAEAKTLTKAQNFTGTLTIEKQQVTLSAKEIHSWIAATNGKITVDQTKAAAYVAKLAKQYNTYGKSQTFKSTKRGTVTVPAGTYGWSIDQATTTAKLVANIQAGKPFTQAVATQGAGYNKDGDGSLIGKTYVEVDKVNQHEWYYQDGKLVLDSPIVTGKPNQATPSGVFFVWAKKRNAKLRGKNDDGSKYASPVSYWMPIDYTGVGLHDSPWQPTYGGDWYKLHGSHGCVNNPPTFMAKLYAAVALGTPVVVY